MGSISFIDRGRLNFGWLEVEKKNRERTDLGQIIKSIIQVRHIYYLEIQRHALTHMPLLFLSLFLE
jgi:hypothetical protein